MFLKQFCDLTRCTYFTLVQYQYIVGLIIDFIDQVRCPEYGNASFTGQPVRIIDKLLSCRNIQADGGLIKNQ